MKKGVIFGLLLVLAIVPVMALSITINSPQNNIVYNSNPVTFNVSLDFYADSIVFSNEIGTILSSCTSCTEKGYSFNIPYTTSRQEGYHFYNVYAVSGSSILNESVFFYIDTQIPNIISTSTSSTYAIPVNFTVNYNEAKLNLTSFSWKVNSGEYSTSSSTSCASGNSQSCSFPIDLSLYLPGDNVTYFFNLTDHFGRINSSVIYSFAISECTLNNPAWNNCSNGLQTRTRSYGCNSTTVTETQACTCNSIWGEWGTWGSCSGGEKQRTRTDTTGCNTTAQVETSHSGCESGSSGNDGGGADTPPSSTATASTYFFNQSQLDEGIYKNMSKDDRIRFLYDNVTHYLTIKSLASDKIIAEISSTPQTVDILKGGTRKFDITDDNFYEVQVTFQDFASATNKAMIFMKFIKEEVSAEQPPAADNSNNTFASTTDTGEGSSTSLTGKAITESSQGNNSTILIRFASVIFGLLIVAYTVFFLVRKRSIEKSENPFPEGISSIFKQEEFSEFKV